MYPLQLDVASTEWVELDARCPPWLHSMEAWGAVTN
jgi:hypothetical protein